MASLLNMSGGSLLGKGLPYDAEIEYLESAGNGSRQGQIINSDILIPSDCRHVEYHFKFMFTRLQKGVLCGHQTSNYNNPRTYLFYSSYATASKEFYAGDKIATVNISALEEVDGYVTLDEDSGKLEYYRDGVLVGQYSMSGTALNRDYPITIFGGSYGNSYDDCAAVRITSFSIVHGNTIVRDFIPVRKYGVGYMYDKVSGKLFGNAGTGSFILGQDKLPLSGVIDMGLPSGTLWAQGNIIKDANGNYAIGEPTDYGCYFSWGNIDGHNEGDGYNFNNGNYYLTPGSQLTGDIPSDDALHDAAVARIGGGWHIPSDDQMTELFNSAYTTNEWTTLNGVNGIRVTSLINGNSIFFPAAGFYNGTSVVIRGSYGFYWLSSSSSASNAYRLYFDSGSVNPQSNYPRYYGLPIRAVHN